MLTNSEHLARLAFEKFHEEDVPAQEHWEDLPQASRDKWQAMIEFIIRLNGGVLT
jgi:hypothetical protein